MSNQQPAWVDGLLDRLAPAHLVEEIKGDLEEIFLSDIARKGLRFAKRRYAFNAIAFLAKDFFWKQQPLENNTNFLIMFNSYFKLARRSLTFYKGNTIINTVGLAVGIASALIIFVLIHFELSFDAYHTNAKNIYRVVRVSGTDISLSESAECRTGVANPVPGAMKEGIPTLANITSMEYIGEVQVDVPEKSGPSLKFREEAGCVLVEPSFFEMFDFKGTGFKWLPGNPKTALTEPFSVVLTKSQADKYFPNGDAMGGVLRFEKEFDGKVTGIIDDFPTNTDFPFTILIAYESEHVFAKDRFTNWASVNDSHQVFVQLAPGTTKAEMEKQIAKIHAANTSKEMSASRHYLLQPLGEVHNDARFGNFNGRTISIETILALGLVGIFLLLTGSINYINLATAQSSLRSKEIGVRKVMGSNRSTLVYQFMTETFIVVSLAGLLSLIIAELAIPHMQSLLNMKVTRFLSADPFVWVTLLTIVFSVAVLSGLYPSFVISSFNPITALKNKFNSSGAGGVSLRKVLVVMQFSLTQILVVGTFIVISQMQYFQNTDMGFNKEAIITMPVPRQHRENMKVLHDQLLAQPFISNVSFSSTFPSGLDRESMATDMDRPHDSSADRTQIFELQLVDPDYLDLYQIRLIAGKNLTPSDSGRSIVLGKTFVKNLQLGTPDNAVGQVLKFGDKDLTVVGVTDDIYTYSLKEIAGNTAFMFEPKRLHHVSIKLNAAENESMTEVIQKIEKIYTGLYPDYLFEYQFFDENIKSFYAQEEKYAMLFKVFSVVLLLISCLGLYGLITFVINRKTKEVAIRKVLGASLGNVLTMFSKEYIQLIVISFVIAAPVSWYACNSWLSNFSQHIALQWWLFVLPGALVLVIALIVVLSKSLRAGCANPVDALKYE